MKDLRNDKMTILGGEDMENIYLTDITGYIGEWLDYGFDDEVPNEVVELLEKAYSLAVKAL